LAQIALEVYRANTQIDVTARNNATLKDFLKDFYIESEDKKTSTAEKEKRKREQMMNTKLFFCCLTGVGMEALTDGKSK
jgi:hypothetical protein